MSLSPHPREAKRKEKLREPGPLPAKSPPKTKLKADRLSKQREVLSMGRKGRLMPKKREESCRKWRQHTAQAQKSKNPRHALQSL